MRGVQVGGAERDRIERFDHEIRELELRLAVFHLWRLKLACEGFMCIYGGYLLGGDIELFFEGLVLLKIKLFLAFGVRRRLFGRGGIGFFFRVLDVGFAFPLACTNVIATILDFIGETLIQDLEGGVDLPVSQHVLRQVRNLFLCPPFLVFHRPDHHPRIIPQLRKIFQLHVVNIRNK